MEEFWPLSEVPYRGLAPSPPSSSVGLLGMVRSRRRASEPSLWAPDSFPGLPFVAACISSVGVPGSYPFAGRRGWAGHTSWQSVNMKTSSDRLKSRPLASTYLAFTLSQVPAGHGPVSKGLLYIRVPAGPDPLTSDGDQSSTAAAPNAPMRLPPQLHACCVFPLPSSRVSPGLPYSAGLRRPASQV